MPISSSSVAAMKMSSGISVVASNFLAYRAKFSFPSRFMVRKSVCLPKICCSQKDISQQQQLNLSVLRFTLGIPGLDESYLPRYIGYAFGALLVLNHFVGSDSSFVTPAQLRSEAIGLSLAVFSTVVPHIGKFLKGSTPTEKKVIPEGVDQIFVMSEGIPDNLREDLAWGTYVLLRNTNSISVLIFMEDALCARGYWSAPMSLSKEDVCQWFRWQIQGSRLSEVKEAQSFQLNSDSEVKKMFHEGIKSLLVLPIQEEDASVDSIGSEKSKGFLLLASSMDYTFTDKDRAWVASIANKFKRMKC